MKYNSTFASLISLICDCLLAFVKFAAGILSSSHALVSDAVHSCADVFSCIIVLIGISAKKAENRKHRFSVNKIETVSLLLLSFVLISTGLAIGISGTKTIFFTEDISVIPEASALFVAVFSLVIKEALFIYNIKVAKKNNNELIRANAWHHQSDALSCMGSFIGILGARLGYPILDPIASVAICLLIIKVGTKIMIDTFKKKK